MFAPLAASLDKSGLVYAANTVHMPKERDKIYPLVGPIFADRAVKEVILKMLFCF